MIILFPQIIARDTTQYMKSFLERKRVMTGLSNIVACKEERKRLRFLCGVFSVSLVMYRAPGNYWGIDLDTCSGVSPSARNPSFGGIAYHWPAVYLVGFMARDPFQAN